MKFEGNRLINDLVSVHKCKMRVGGHSGGILFRVHLKNPFFLEGYGTYTCSKLNPDMYYSAKIL